MTGRIELRKDSVLTVRELAQFLRIGINAAYSLVQNGTIRSVRVGRQYRIPAREVEKYLTSSYGDAADPDRDF